MAHLLTAPNDYRYGLNPTTIAYFKPKMFVTIAVLALLAAAASLYTRGDRRLRKINGPKGNPLFGLGLALPPNATQKLREWAVKYGEIYKIRIGWYYWVVLNSPEAIKEVFDRQVCPNTLFTILN